MFGTFVRSKEMDESDGDEPNGGGVEINLQDVHYEREAAAHRQRAFVEQRAARRQRAAAAEGRQRAAADRFQRLEDQRKSLKVLLDGAVGSDGHENETRKDYINRMIIEASADIVETGLPLLQQLNGSNWFKQLLKLQSILKEYLTAKYNHSCTPDEIEGLDIYWNKYPCSILRDRGNWLYTKKWDFYCSDKGRIDIRRIDSEYVQNYIKRAEKFLKFLEPEATKRRQRAAGRRQKLAERQIAEHRQRAAAAAGRQRAADRQIQDEKKWRRDEKRRNNERLRRNKQRRNKSNSYDEEYRDRDFNRIGGGDRKYGE